MGCRSNCTREPPATSSSVNDQRVPLAAVAAVALLLLAGIALGIGVGSEESTVLVVTDQTGTEQLVVPVESGDEVAIEYTHSVERTLVTDVYVVSDGVLVSSRMLFSSFGAGLPAQADVTRRGDRYVYEPPEQRFETLSVATGPIAGHELVVAGERYDLFSIAEGGTVLLSIETR